MASKSKQREIVWKVLHIIFLITILATLILKTKVDEKSCKNILIYHIGYVASNRIFNKMNGYIQDGIMEISICNSITEISVCN